MGKKVILYLSILVRYKRPDKLIRVLPQLIEREPNVFSYMSGRMLENWRRSAHWRRASV